MNAEPTKHHFEIGGRIIGPGYPVYIVAEMSANHNQDYEQAVEILKAAKWAGADAIKLQTYTPDTLTIDCDKEYFRIKGTLWDGRTLYDLYGEAFTPWEWQPKLKAVADELEMDLFSSPFDDSAVEFLESMNVPAYKVASFENVDLQLIQTMARTGKPIIMSTGMATLSEIDEAVQAIRSAGGSQLLILKCNSSYPAPPEEMNLLTMAHLAEAFGVPTGLSDHSLGDAVPIGAAALGACMIEKHITVSRSTSGPDSVFSLEPDEFKAMVDSIRIVEKAVGKVQYGYTPQEAKSRPFRRSLFIVQDVKAGMPFTSENVRSIRPADGLPPKYLPEVIGRRASVDIERGTPMNWSYVAGR